MNSTRLFWVRGLFLLAVCFSLTAAHAQFRAGIQGTVTDSSGAVIKEAQITVTNQATGVSQTTTSNAEGFYSVSHLGPGLYTVTAEAKGFKKNVTNYVDVAAESTKGLNLTLSAGATTEQVVVNGEALPAVQTEDANLTGTITSKQVQDLPQFRGDPFELVRTTPGVFGLGARDSGGRAQNLPNYSGTGGSIFGIYQTENAVQVSANGQRVDANGFTLDGVGTNSQGHGGATVVTPNQESVQEVKVEVNSYNAENGHNAGAVIETISKSGTNQLHGSLGLRVHSPSLNAFQRWGGPTSSPQRDNLVVHNEFGSIGGPIIKNRLFAFFSFDHQTTGGNYRAQNWVETPDYIAAVTAQRSGSIAAQVLNVKGAGFTDAKAGLIPNGQNPCVFVGLADDGVNCHAITGTSIDIGSLTGAPGTIVNSANGGGLDGVADLQFIDYQALPDQTKATQFNGRMDFQATNKDLIAFSVYKSPFLKTFLPGGWVDGRQYDTFNSDTQHDAATALWTRTISSNTVNEARVNVTHWYFDELKGNPQAPWGLPSGNITIPNNGLGVGFFSTPGIFHQATYGFRDTLSRLHKSHVLKFGVAIDREQNNDTSAWGAHPNYSFNNLWSYANDAPSSQGTSTFDPKTGIITAFPKYVRVTDYAFFGQDTWKVKPNLTLTMGLRWEYFTPIHDKENTLSHVVLGQGANALTDLRIKQGGNLSSSDFNNFGPQLGFAWSPGRTLGHDWNNRFVLRGGFGVAYTKVGEATQLNARANPPSFVAANLNQEQLIYATSTKGPYSFDGFPANPNTLETFDPTTGLPIPGGAQYALPNIAGADPNLRTPYTWHYSLEGQYDLGNRWSASVSYQGSQSRKLTRTINYNLLYTPNPNVGTVFLTRSDTNSSYNAVLFRVTKSLSHGLQLNANYRYAHTTDFCSYDESCGQQQSYPINQGLERGPADFDVRHSFTGYAVYELPFFRSRNDVLKTIAGGWQLSTIVTLNSGFPWSPVFSYNGATCADLTIRGISCTARPEKYLGGAGSDGSTDTFKKAGGNFPNGPLAYFVPLPNGTTIPGVARNSFRGPRYTGIDMQFGKRFTLPKIPVFGENAGLEVKANAFNVFNKLNLSPFGFNSDSTRIGSADPLSGVASTPNPRFGQATGALSGRVIELTARFSF